ADDVAAVQADRGRRDTMGDQPEAAVDRVDRVCLTLGPGIETLHAGEQPLAIRRPGNRRRAEELRIRTEAGEPAKTAAVRPDSGDIEGVVASTRFQRCECDLRW